MREDCKEKRNKHIDFTSNLSAAQQRRNRQLVRQVVLAGNTYELRKSASACAYLCTEYHRIEGDIG